MPLQSFECKNCGTSLQVEQDQEYVKCPSCRSVHEIEHRADGTLQVTMLREVREAVGRVENEAAGIASLQKALADRENAKIEIEQARAKYAKFVPVRDAKIKEAKEWAPSSREKAWGCGCAAALMLCFTIIGIAEGAGWWFAICFGLPALLSAWVSLFWATFPEDQKRDPKQIVAMYEREDKAYQQRIADLLERTRRRIDIGSSDGKSGQPAGVEASHEESILFKLVLKAVGENKRQVVSAANKHPVMTRKDVKTVKTFMEGPPTLVKDGLSKEQAVNLAAALGAAGAHVEIELE